jgi:GNAT superfamily N-acetyltransferase
LHATAPQTRCRASCTAPPLSSSSASLSTSAGRWAPPRGWGAGRAVCVGGFLGDTKREAPAPSLKPSQVGHIEDVVVDSAARGQKLGQKWVWGRMPAWRSHRQLRLDDLPLLAPRPPLHAPPPPNQRARPALCPNPTLLSLRLIEELTRVCHERGCYKVILDCAEHNVAFYEKCGLTRKEIQMVGGGEGPSWARRLGAAAREVGFGCKGRRLRRALARGRSGWGGCLRGGCWQLLSSRRLPPLRCSITRRLRPAATHRSQVRYLDR